MELSDLKRIIADQRLERASFMRTHRLVERQVDLKKLRHYLSAPNALVITGPRRCGKSVLAHLLLASKKYAYVNFDDDRLSGLATADLSRVFDACLELFGDQEYFIFDEIQNVPGWERFISRLRQTKKVIVTGSNARLLGGELATFLTGRYIPFTLYPFSFKEYLRWKKIGLQPAVGNTFTTAEEAGRRRYLTEYLESGGFPEALTLSPDIVPTIYRDIVERDIIARYRFKGAAVFRQMASYLLSAAGQRISIATLRRTFGIKEDRTVKKYLEALRTAFLFFLVYKFSYKLKQQFISPRKLYAVDSGLLHALAFRFSDNRGAAFENAVYLELLRRQSYADASLEIYYWQDYRGREVDFIIKSGPRVKQLIQVCAEFSRPETKAREIKALAAASAELKCYNLLIITDEEEGEEKIANGIIKIVPLWRWLLIV